MSDELTAADVHQADLLNDLLYDDEFKPDLGDAEDIGTFDPGEGFDDGDELDEEPDELPEVGPLDVDEEPILDELEDEEWDPSWDAKEEDVNG